MGLPKRKVVFQSSIFRCRCYVSFREDIIEWQLKAALKMWIHQTFFGVFHNQRLPPLGRGISVKRHRARGAIASTVDGGWEDWDGKKMENWCLNGIDSDSDSSGMFMTALGIPVLLSRKNTIATNICTYITHRTRGYIWSLGLKKQISRIYLRTTNGCKSVCMM